MFYHSDIKRFTLNVIDYISGSYPTSSTTSGTIFVNCSQLSYVSVPGIKKIFPNGVTIMSGGPENGTIVVSNDDGITAGSNGVPETWTVEYALN